MEVACSSGRHAVCRGHSSRGGAAPNRLPEYAWRQERKLAILRRIPASTGRVGVQGAGSTPAPPEALVRPHRHERPEQQLGAGLEPVAAAAAAASAPKGEEAWRQEQQQQPPQQQQHPSTAAGDEAEPWSDGNSTVAASEGSSSASSAMVAPSEGSSTATGTRNGGGSGGHEGSSTCIAAGNPSSSHSPPNPAVVKAGSTPIWSSSDTPQNSATKEEKALLREALAAETEERAFQRVKQLLEEHGDNPHYLVAAARLAGGCRVRQVGAGTPTGGAGELPPTPPLSLPLTHSLTAGMVGVRWGGPSVTPSPPPPLSHSLSLGVQGSLGRTRPPLSFSGTPWPSPPSPRWRSRCALPKGGQAWAGGGAAGAHCLRGAGMGGGQAWAEGGLQRMGSSTGLGSAGDGRGALCAAEMSCAWQRLLERKKRKEGRHGPGWNLPQEAPAQHVAGTLDCQPARPSHLPPRCCHRHRFPLPPLHLTFATASCCLPLPPLLQAWGVYEASQGRLDSSRNLLQQVRAQALGHGLWLAAGWVAGRLELYTFF